MAASLKWRAQGPPDQDMLPVLFAAQLVTNQSANTKDSECIALESPGAEGTCAAVACSAGLEAMLANMGELWDEKEYEQQFDMQSFMEKLGRGRK